MTDIKMQTQAQAQIKEDSCPQNINYIKGIFESTLYENFSFMHESIANKYVVLYFYPKNNTPGCTTQALDFRNMLADFHANDVVVLGVSRDTLKSHTNFSNKFELKFNLISDVDEVLCDQFEVIKQKKMYGKDVRGIQRSTFVYDKKGILINEYRAIKIPEHVQGVLQLIKDHD
jgi:thioredoxin-dependent peroxiredoxin